MVPTPTSENATPEQQIGNLEAEVKRLREALHATRSEMQASGREIRTEVETEKTEHAKQPQAVRRAVCDTAPGGLHLAATGLTWLLFGLTWSTVPGWLVGAVALGLCVLNSNAWDEGRALGLGTSFRGVSRRPCVESTRTLPSCQRLTKT